MDLNAVLMEVDSWPVEDRIRLVRAVWEHIAEQGHEPGISEDLKAECDRQLAAHRANP